MGDALFDEDDPGALDEGAEPALAVGVALVIVVKDT